jgi:hypothetical protein
MIPGTRGLKRKELRLRVERIERFWKDRQQKIMTGPSIFNGHMQSESAIDQMSGRERMGFQKDFDQLSGGHQSIISPRVIIQICCVALLTQDKMKRISSIRRFLLKDPLVRPPELM